MREIVHYGVCDLAYSSYVLEGLHHHARMGELKMTIRRRLPASLAEAAGGHEYGQMLPLFEARGEGKPVRFCIDHHDKADFVHSRLIEAVDHYFKANYDPEQMARLGLTEDQQSKITPLGCPFTPLRLPRWAHRPTLRPEPAVGWGWHDMARRVRQLSRLSTIDEIRSLRSVPKTHDVTFVVRLYRQAHHAPINEFRREVARRLHEHPNIDAVVGFIGHTIAGPRRFDAAQTSPREHLARLAGSRLGLYVWGTHQCLSFKLCEFLALGLPIVGQSIPQDRANLAGLPGFADQFGYDDPTDLVDAVAAALDNPDGLIKLGESNATVFDSHLAPPICAQRILDVVYRS